MNIPNVLMQSSKKLPLEASPILPPHPIPLPRGRGIGVKKLAPLQRAGRDVVKVLQRYLFMFTTDEEKL